MCITGVETLLCYLELHPQRFVELLHPTLSVCKISCYDGPRQLQRTTKMFESFSSSLCVFVIISGSNWIWFSFLVFNNRQLPPGGRGVGEAADGRRAGGDVRPAGVWRGGGGRHDGVAASSGEAGPETAAVEHRERCVSGSFTSRSSLIKATSSGCMLDRRAVWGPPPSPKHSSELRRPVHANQDLVG